ncbi:MAG: hypothetical protein K0S90_77 [Enterobacteriaceae bacterium]|jgi:hypothetical protein|nr:hypothetical protein [Pseudescherichia sp.]MDF2776554.1 hypothetical protein [Enterobacteriaceae bacterium]
MTLKQRVEMLEKELTSIKGAASKQAAKVWSLKMNSKSTLKGFKS